MTGAEPNGTVRPAPLDGLASGAWPAEFGAVPPLQARRLGLAEKHAPESVGVAAGLNIAGFNSGIVVGSAIGGVTMGTFGGASTALVAAIAATLGTMILIAQFRK